jgi:hypothetical protein
MDNAYVSPLSRDGPAVAALFYTYAAASWIDRHALEYAYLFCMCEYYGVVVFYKSVGVIYNIARKIYTILYVLQ